MPIRVLPPVYSPIGLRRLARVFLDQLRQDGAPVLEQTFAASWPNRSVHLTASGSHALVLALAMARNGRTPPVVAVPAYCCPDVAAAAIAADCRLLLYDTEPETLTPDMHSLQAALAAGATHVVAVHLYGIPVDVAAVAALCQSYGAMLIEDAAQAAGAVVNGQRAGALAPLGIVSFGRGKGINAGGGGAVIVADSWAGRPVGPLPLPSPLSSLVQWCRVGLTQALSHPLLYAVPSAIPWLGIGDTVYRPVSTPMGASRTTRLLVPIAEQANAAALGHRRALAALYTAQLADHPAIGLVRAAWEDSGALRYPVRLAFEGGAQLRRMGVVRSYPRTLADYAEVRAVLAGAGSPLPGAALLARTMYTLPTHGRCSEPQARRITNALRERAHEAADHRIVTDR